MKNAKGGWVAMAEQSPFRAPFPSRSSNFAFREKGVRKTKTRKAQREDSRNVPFRGRTLCKYDQANGPLGAVCSSSSSPSPSRRATKVTDRLFPCSIVPRFPDEFTVEWPFPSTGIEHQFFSTILLFASISTSFLESCVLLFSGR